MSKQKLMSTLVDYNFPINYSPDSKEDVLDFLLNYNIDKSGTLTKESGFKKFFPKLYQQFLQITFPEECKTWKFTHKLYHFLHNDIELHLGICENCHTNRCNFNNFKIGYKRFCCPHCSATNEETLNKKNKTIINKYGSIENFKSISLEHTKQTNQQNHGVDIWTNRTKAEETFKNKYGSKSYMGTSEFRKKRINYYQTNYGCDNNSQINDWYSINSQKYFEKTGYYNPMSNPEIKQKSLNNRTTTYTESANKAYNTRKKNGTLNTSTIEQNISQYLKDLNINYISQYKSEKYPFHCDFYFPDYDLYVEIQAHWTHGKHPFDCLNKNDIELLNKWKTKCGIRNNGQVNQYVNGVNVWTQRDPLKRETAKNNNLNYLEIFSVNVDECLNQIITKIKELE